VKKLHRFYSEHIGTDYSGVKQQNRASFAEYSVKLARYEAGIWRNIAPTWQLDPKRPEPHMMVVYEIRRILARYAGSGRFASP